MSVNPFEVTKAVDFSDAEIAATWVDLPGGGFEALADPRSPMPRFLVGGKGGGRTHLLRYFSYSLQCLRHADNAIDAIRTEGYVGIYFRCGGLNSSRFAGKKQDAETWSAVFAYYTEVWLGRLIADLIADLARRHPTDFPTTAQQAFAEAVCDLFDVAVPLARGTASPAADLGSSLRDIQRGLDVVINNAALTHELDVQIGASPGRLVFGIPRAAREHLSAVDGVAFAYLFDEFENLTLEQQKYVNTLLREKELPSTFLIGSRRFGIRTHLTLSAGEENRQGSEFDQVVLEDAYRADEHKYPEFCRSIVHRRLMEAGYEIGAQRQTDLEEFFSHPSEPSSKLEERALSHIQEKLGRDSSVRPPWHERLARQLRTAGYEALTEPVLEALRFPESPLHEKFALLLFYRAWADRVSLEKAATDVQHQVRELISGMAAPPKLRTSYKHYRHDLYAQLLAQLRLPQEYSGFQDFVRMSGYLPRNLLVVLKQVTRWALFLGEEPYASGRMSFRAQREGIHEASTWFLSDAKGLGQVGEETQLAIRRLGSLFREMRFADKPVEVSCSAFSTDRQGVAPGALRCLDEAVSHSLILEVPNGRRDKNTHVLQHKYQLNPMLAPLFDLSLALRGSLSPSSEDLDGIFDPDASRSGFEAVRRRTVERMQAPFSSNGAEQESLGI